MTACETLPRNSDLTPVSPRVPITTALAPTSSAWSRIVSAIVLEVETVRGWAL